MTSACGSTNPTSAGARAGLLAARWLMAGLFLFSGAAKLGWLDSITTAGIDPYTFAGSVKGFRLLHNDLIPFITFFVPWLEVVSGAALLLGLWARGAARVIAALLILFCLAMLTVIIRGLDVECTCFGKFLGGAVNGWSILRNVVLLAIIWPVARYGPGMLAVENVFNRGVSPLDRNG